MKRNFDVIRKKILYVLNQNNMSRMEISRSVNADYRTVDRHLIWLIGYGKIRRIRRDKKTVYKLS